MKHPLQHDTVTSKDGTVIGYRTCGSGPGVIVIPGVLASADDYAPLADALGERFTVHTVDRRGRGRSGPQGDDYGLDRECEDVAALQAGTGAGFLLGHSFGGLIALEAARRHTAIEKIAVYEPGVSVGGSIATDWIPAYEQRLAENNPLDAFVAFSLACGPEQVRTTPSWLMKLLLPLVLRREERRRMFGLLRENAREHRAIASRDSASDRYRDISARVLVMHGGRSGLSWVAPAVQALRESLPSVEVRAFPNLDHSAPKNKGHREVAQAVKDFFAP